MTITDQIKILNKKILKNEAQYDLDKKFAITFARSSKNLDKVEYLTSEDLGLKLNTIEQALDEEDLDVVMPMYNLLEYSKNYRKTTSSL